MTSKVLKFNIFHLFIVLIWLKVKLIFSIVTDRIVGRVVVLYDISNKMHFCLNKIPMQNMNVIFASKISLFKKFSF